MSKNNDRRLEVNKLRKEIKEALKIRGQQRIEKELILNTELDQVRAINEKLLADQKHVDSFGEREGMHNREILEIKDRRIVTSYDKK